MVWIIVAVLIGLWILDVVIEKVGVEWAYRRREKTQRRKQEREFVADSERRLAHNVGGYYQFEPSTLIHPLGHQTQPMAGTPAEVIEQLIGGK